MAFKASFVGRQSQALSYFEPLKKQGGAEDLFYPEQQGGAN